MSLRLGFLRTKCVPKEFRLDMVSEIKQVTQFFPCFNFQNHCSMNGIVWMKIFAPAQKYWIYYSREELVINLQNISELFLWLKLLIEYYHHSKLLESLEYIEGKIGQEKNPWNSSKNKNKTRENKILLFMVDILLTQLQTK